MRFRLFVIAALCWNSFALAIYAGEPVNEKLVTVDCDIADQPALSLPGWAICNTDVCKTPDGYVAAFEIGLCEFQGKTVIYYSWGNQQGIEFLAEAQYPGPVSDLLCGFFPED